MSRPWTDRELRQLRKWSRNEVTAEQAAKLLGRHVGSVRKKARELGLILYKSTRANSQLRRHGL
jgi:hypothetical protein